jgi:hypothetical protein
MSKFCVNKTTTDFQEMSMYRVKYDHKVLLPDAGSRSRAIIPGDDPGDQQPPEQRCFYPDPRAIAANSWLARIRRDGTAD